MNGKENGAPPMTEEEALAPLKKKPSLLGRIWELVSVHRCHCCGIRVPRGEILCEACGLDYAAAQDRRCGDCTRLLSECTCSMPYLAAHRVRRLHKLLPYKTGDLDNGVTRLLLRLKHCRPGVTFEFCADGLARAMEGRIAKKEDWVICHIPRSRGARNRYGYDQAQCLAKLLAERLEIPYCALLGRRRGVGAERGLTREERRTRMQGAFYVKDAEQVWCRRILVLDDVVTSGAGLAAAADALYAAGARRVEGVALAVARRWK